MKKLLMALGAALILALGSSVGFAKPGGGHGGGGFTGGGGGGGGGGPSFSSRSGGNMGGRSFSGRSFSGRNFSGRNFSSRSYSHNGNFGRRGSRYAYRDGRHHRHHGRSFVFAYPYYDDYYDYDYGYGYGGCGWLYSRAVSTGSSYWWNRYEDCVS